MADEGNSNEVTYSVDKDGSLVAKGTEGEVRYVKESDLLALKGSKETIEKRVRELEEASRTGGAGAQAELETTRQKVLQAEAEVERLKEKMESGTVTATELERAKAELATAKSSGEELSNKLLELQRNLIVATFGVPKTTVDNKKSLQELEVYAQALEDVTGKKLGNYAAGGGGGGAADLTGVSPMELARRGYEQSSK